MPPQHEGLPPSTSDGPEWNGDGTTRRTFRGIRSAIVEAERPVPPSTTRISLGHGYLLAAGDSRGAHCSNHPRAFVSRPQMADTRRSANHEQPVGVDRDACDQEFPSTWRRHERQRQNQTRVGDEAGVLPGRGYCSLSIEAAARRIFMLFGRVVGERPGRGHRGAVGRLASWGPVLTWNDITWHQLCGDARIRGRRTQPRTSGGFTRS